jgi:hypothetical protein
MFHAYNSNFDILTVGILEVDIKTWRPDGGNKKSRLQESQVRLNENGHRWRAVTELYSG